MKLALLLAAAGASLLVTSGASAAKRTFAADMSFDQENATDAPLDLGDHAPNGTIKVTFDDVTKELCGEIAFNDLTGIASGVHIHIAPADNPEGDGPVKLEIPPTATPVHFNLKLNADFEKGLNDGLLYANIHTVKNAKGECRSETPWIEDEEADPVPCPPATPQTPTDAGAPDAAAPSTSSSSSGSSTGTSSSSGSSTSTGDDDDDSNNTSGSTSTGGKDAGAAAKKKDEGGCNTTGDSGSLSFFVVLGVGLAAAVRGRRRKR